MPDPGLTRRKLVALPLAAALPAAAAARAPLLDGMGRWHAADVSPDAQARRYFAQGMVLAWGFNPAESARSFAGALDHDPRCAAACWGKAWALGPNLNADMTLDDAPRVMAALDRARSLRAGAAPRWRDLIDALASRHPAPDRADEGAYANRMRSVAERHPRDADLATLAAEARMSEHAYDWWHADGRPQPWTPEIERLLARALSMAPEHPGANHAWVHLFERSATPERAAAAADRLRHLVPGSGHLLHMPAHIDLRLGRYDAASAAGEASIAADRRYLEQVEAQGAHRVGYVAHNHHFLWASAAMQGRGARAIEAAREAFGAACGPRRPPRLSGTLQYFQALPLFALVRFGRWQQILSGTLPPDGDGPYPLAIWHYARATAALRSGRAADAEAEATRLDALAGDPALASLKVKNLHAASALVQIARLTLQGDQLAAQGRPDAAVAAFERAVALEDAFAADEPHLWLAPTRHALGAALLQAGRAAEAMRVFRADLRHYPANGWSLAGLARAERLAGRVASADRTEARAMHAWRHADVTSPTPRL